MIKKARWKSRFFYCLLTYLLVENAEKSWPDCPLDLDFLTIFATLK